MFFTAVLVQACIKTILCLRSSSFLLRKGYEISSSDSTLDVSYSNSLLQCASRCLSYNDCQVASFDKSASMCSLHGNAYLSDSNNSRYEIIEIAGKEKTVSENHMTSMTTETFEHFETTGRSGTIVTLETTKAFETTVALKTTVPLEKTDTSGSTTTSLTAVVLETEVASETTTLKTTVTSGTSGTTTTMNWTTLGASDCFSTTSLEYSGTWAYTVSGIPCQYWNQNNTPHTIEFLPVDTTAHGTNYCRETTNGEGAPGCYTTNSSEIKIPSVPVGTRYSFQVGKNNLMKFTCDYLTPNLSPIEHCPVSVCGDDNQWTTDFAVSCSHHDCYTDGSANTYMGKVTCTISGRACMRWEVVETVVGSQTLSGADKKSNYCRDPDEKGKPWCYVSTSPTVEWEYCPVPTCL